MSTHKNYVSSLISTSVCMWYGKSFLIFDSNQDKDTWGDLGLSLDVESMLVTPHVFAGTVWPVDTKYAHRIP